jgi:hypothetical protein
MSDNDPSHHHHHHHHHHKVLDKITSKISALKDDITDAVRERTHSNASDRRNSTSTDSVSIHTNDVNFTLHDDLPSPNIETRQTFRAFGM